ncbi:hypothetical protein LWH94_12790 [Marinobacter sp. G11]|uniref:hypothetical protein n=1 Tax=Marinobacter sp. G11 TaxID=2903522 RepID=UPI001E3A770F|nr:hypothetical protein [Marinobacter sp. G11]MCE0760079.1 hypothetical protein [Marinobacter sp. G11]
MTLKFDSENPEALLVEIVQPRPDWYAMDRIANLMPRIVSAFDQISQPIEGADAFLEWLDSGVVEAKYTELAPERQGIRGLVGEYPQHAGLRALAESEECSEKRLQVVAYVINTASAWRQELAPSEERSFKNRVEDAWRALRLLSESALAKVPKCVDDVARFEKHFARVNENLDQRQFDEKNVRYLDELHRFFKFYVGEGRIITYQSDKQKAQRWEVQKTGDWKGLDNDVDSEIEGVQERSVHITLPQGEELVSKEHRIAGNAPEELMSASVLISERGAALNSERGETPSTGLRKQQPKRAAYRRANSFLPGRWESLNEYERGLVLQVLFENKMGSENTRLHVLLILLTGRSLESISETAVVQNRSQVPDKPKKNQPECIYLVRDDQAWAGFVPEPPERRKLAKKWAPHMEVTNKLFIGPIPDAFWQILRPRVELVARRIQTKSGILFARRTSTESVAEEIAIEIKKLNKATGSRITLKRIQTCVFEGLIHQTTDSVDASLVTGRKLPTGQSANLYYHTRSVETLAADYVDVVNGWLVNLGLSSPSMAPANLDFGLPRVGSPFCVRLEVMRDVVSRLRAQLAEYRKTAHSRANIRKFHNLFTAYAILQVMWSTGFRAVRDPIAYRYEFNERRGFVIIADKVDDNLGHSRLVYLPEVVIEQLRCYEAHRRHLQLRLHEVGVEVPIETFFVFLDAKLQSEFATPKRLADEIQWTFPWPLNVSRHTLRGFLRDQGVPGYLVDVFMGHWGVGTEPLAKYSSLDLAEMKNRIVPATAALLDELGFEVEAGLDA